MESAPAGHGRPGLVVPGGSPPPPDRRGPGSRAGGRHAWRVAIVVAAVIVAALFVRSALTAGPSVGPTIPAEVRRGVVDIVSTVGVQGQTVAGTGMVLTSTGEVLTNNHVIDEATSIAVTDVADGRTYVATVLGTDPSADVAVLQMVGASALKTVTLRVSSEARVGDPVIAVGNAGGMGGTPSSARGTITALHQSIVATDSMGISERLSGLIQTDAAVEAGDSGGPLADTKGQVVGVDTAESNGYSFDTGVDEGYAIPVSEAVGVVTQIEQGRASNAIHIGPTAYLGVTVETAPAGSGALVIHMVNGSPAQQIGLSVGDVIVSLNGTSISSASGLTAEMRTFHPGDTVNVAWADTSDAEHSAAVVLVTGPAD
jgi:S1-C subfamily serine protease